MLKLHVFYSLVLLVHASFWDDGVLLKFILELLVPLLFLQDLYYEFLLALLENFFGSYLTFVNPLSFIHRHQLTFDVLWLHQAVHFFIDFQHLLLQVLTTLTFLFLLEFFVLLAPLHLLYLLLLVLYIAGHVIAVGLGPLTAWNPGDLKSVS